MRTPLIIAIALLLPLGSNSAAHAQWSNAYPVGVSHEHVLTTGTSLVARRDTSRITPRAGADRKWSEAAVGAMVGGAVGLAISVLTYKTCADHSPASDKSACGIAVMVIMPATIGGGAIIGDLLGMVHARSGR